MTVAAGQRVLVAGGAGFLGSRIAARYVAAGWDVTVVDGLLERTGGCREHLAPLQEQIRFIPERIESLTGLPRLVAGMDVIIDSMAWTAHRLAMRDPIRDLHLNAESHLHLIQALPAGSASRVIYLGSRVQFGDHPGTEIHEDTPMVPRDVQGIHKLTGELYFRVYASTLGLKVVSLRLPNCFGPHQPVTGEDIGLVGSMIRDLLQGRTVEVFGDGRRRGFVFAEDAAEVVYRAGRLDREGFTPLNFGGWSLTIEELVKHLVEIVGTGGYTRAPLPADLRHVDMGNAQMTNQGLAAVLGEVPMTDLHAALSATVAYVRAMTGGRP
jgi:nucleoside-diphosphate-sugar epimerase